MPVSPSSSGGSGGAGAGTALYPGAASHPLSSLLSQQRLLELSRFGLRHYDIAHHVLSQQGAVTKLLGKYFNISKDYILTSWSEIQLRAFTCHDFYIFLLCK